MGSAIIESAVDLAWSLWTELGVPGVVRNHAHVVIDPEPLIVASALIIEHDARLRDQVFGWCAAHADRVSASRLQGLLKASSDDVRAAFGGFSATLRQMSVPWPTVAKSLPWPRAPEVTAPSLDPRRPALLRLRLRALCGVGARADVVAELLAARDQWVVASDLTHLGYSKRNVARILADLSGAGLVASRSARNAAAHALTDRAALGALVGVEGLTFVRWDAALRLVTDALTLTALSNKSERVRRVEAAKIADRLRASAAAVGVAPPPLVRGDPDAWSRLVEWCAATLDDLAQGMPSGRGRMT